MIRQAGSMAATPKGRVPREVREREMIAAAREAFSARGYHAASMDEIAEASGISKPMLYNYFESKDGLFVACVREAAADLFAEVRAAAAATDLPPEQRLWRGLLAVFAWVEENREGWRVLYLDASQSAVIAESGSRARDLMAELMVELLTGTAVEQGVSPQMRPHIEPMAHALTAATMAAADWWVEHPGEPRELQALRLMNFAWTGFEQMLAGHLWVPPPGTPTR
jgi:AcrR family transcriptional regulator